MSKTGVTITKTAPNHGFNLVQTVANDVPALPTTQDLNNSFGKP